MKENYEGVNPARDTTQRWCISCKMSSTMKQATVQFADGKHINTSADFRLKRVILQLLGILIQRKSAAIPFPWKHRV